MDNPQKTDFDSQMMQRCINLALQAKGKTAPNPLVGAIAVKDGKIIGEGFHPSAGKPHAEVFALKQAGKQAKNATVYVNLEPCHHYGKTPPCTESLIEAGVKKVIIGTIDPNPLVSGKGIEALTKAGIEVMVGVEEEACRQLNEAYIHRVTHQSPFGIFKYAMTLDGKIASETGHSAWVTGKSARNYVHQLRSACDAVIIGGNTVRQDNPHLTTHGVSDRNPLRVVMSKGLDLPTNCHLWQTEIAPTVVFTEKNSNVDLQKFLLTRGVEVIELASVTPQQVMENLYQRGFCAVLWECGGVLAAKAIASGCVQKILAFIAPKIIGGINAPSPIANLGLAKMNQALELKNLKINQFESDYLIEGYIYLSTEMIFPS
jgi:diaminohydroxyphosphoribosylaminopyrimidine deaminase/5-amino-6-(5-phosphoribosylamino)uracil reductase